MSNDLQALLRELDARIRDLESLPQPELRERIFTVLQLVDGLHRGAVERVAELLEEGGMWEAAVNDERVGLLLALYDQVPVDDVARAEDALAPVRPYIRSHGGEVEVLRVVDGVVHVRLVGSCRSCSAAGATLSHGVETALREGFAGFRGMVVQDTDEPPHPGWVDLPVVQAGGARPGGPVFREIGLLTELPTDRATLRSVEGNPVLLVRAEEDAYAYDATCPGCGLTLEGAKLSGHVLVCTWTNCAFDVRSGRRVDGEPGRGLRVYPVSVQRGRVLLALDFSPTSLFRNGS